MLRWVLVLNLAALALGSMCPMEEHQICNGDSFEHKCVCAMTREESAPPEVSCNQLIDRDENGNFPVVSVTLKIDDSSEGREEWPEEDFVNKIASALRVDDEDVLVLRASCEGTDDTLVVQFAILKKDANSSDLPYDEDDFVDAISIAQRMKSMSHLAKIPDIPVESIEATEELVDIEFDSENSKLVYQAIGAGVFCIVSSILAIIVACRSKDYSDDLQKA
ncbi:unnamed protein product, partial [Mesorhabditis spiculigera]